jgi:outer membrane protein insertion porin family
LISNINSVTGIKDGFLSILRFTGGLGTQLVWPDDNFATNTSLNLERIRLDNYTGFYDNGGSAVRQGDFYNISLRQTFARSTVSEPLYPRSGSRISLTLSLTPPYSLFKGSDWNPDSLNVQDKYRWVEYHKWRFDGEWYYNLVGKLVLGFNAKMGLIGYYNKQLGAPPFERFDVGGNGLNNQSFTVTGRDIISMRAYEIRDIKAKNASDYYAPNNDASSTIFNKFTLDLRYPLSLNPSATIFATVWAQGGNAWYSFKEYNPLDLKRSVGVGVRVFLPMFGLLGFDYGWGFDKPWLKATHAPIKQYANFSFILGFEPD